MEQPRIRIIDSENINRFIENHPDKGCDLFPSCLGECPFNECLYRAPRAKLERKRELLRAGLKGLNKVLKRGEVWPNWA